MVSFRVADVQGQGLGEGCFGQARMIPSVICSTALTSIPHGALVSEYLLAWR